MRLLGEVQIPGGAHTITAFPGRSLVYASPGGWNVDPFIAGFDENDMPVVYSPEPTEDIIDVSNPSRPRIVKSFKPNEYGCHDVSFHVTKTKKLGFCAGSRETVVWDVSNPLSPRTLSTITNGAYFQHSAVASPDGKLLVIGDEAYLGHDCEGGPTGAMWIYDISDPANPALKSFFKPSRGAAPEGDYYNWTPAWCTAHNYNFIPGTRTLVGAFYSAGTSVVDLKDPAIPKEIAYFRADNSEAWSSYYYRGRIYSTDSTRGLDVLTLTARPS